MIERYILVSDEEYCYTLDTEAEDYKTLEDFEKIEFENAKKDNVDIGEYEDAILQLANDNYWDWVYNNHLEADTVNDIMNVLYEENIKIKSLLFKKIEQLNNDYERSARAGMPSGGIIGELDSFEEICEKMRWKND